MTSPRRTFRTFSVGGSTPPSVGGSTPPPSSNPFDSLDEVSSSSHSSEHQPVRAPLTSSKSTPDVPSISDLDISKKSKKPKKSGFKNLFKTKKKSKTDVTDVDNSKEEDKPTQSREEEGSTEEKPESSLPSGSPVKENIPAWVSPRQRSVTSSTTTSPPVWHASPSQQQQQQVRTPVHSPRIGQSLTSSTEGILPTTTQARARVRAGSLSAHRSTVSLDSPPKLHIKDTLEQVVREITEPPPDHVHLKKGDGFSPFMDLQEVNEVSKPLAIPLAVGNNNTNTSRNGMILDSGNGVIIVQVPQPPTPAAAIAAAPLPFNPSQYDDIQVANNAKNIQNIAMTNALMSTMIEEESSSLLQDVLKSSMNKKLQHEAAEGNVMALDIMAKQSKEVVIESIFDKIEARRDEVQDEQEDEDFINEYNDILKYMASDLPDNEISLAPLRKVGTDRLLEDHEEEEEESEEDSSSSGGSVPATIILDSLILPPPLPIENHHQGQVQSPKQTPTIPKLSLPPTPKDDHNPEEEEEEEESYLKDIKSQLHKPTSPDQILEKIKQMSTGTTVTSNPKEKKRKERHYKSSNDSSIQLLMEEQTKIFLNALKLESSQKNQSFMLLAKSIYQNNLTLKHLESNQLAQKEIAIQQQTWQGQLVETIKQLTLQLQGKASGPSGSESGNNSANAETYMKMEKNYQKITTMLQTMLITLQHMSETVSKYQLELAVVQRVANQQQVEHTRIMNIFEEKFKAATADYEDNKQMLGERITRLKKEAKEAKQIILSLNQEVANQERYNFAIMQALEKNHKTVVVQELPGGEGNEGRGTLVTKHSNGIKKKK